MKAVGKMRGNIESSEDQLQDYNFFNTASITILTDGKIWRFYLSSATGTFAQKLFCTFDLIEDNIDYIVSILTEVLSKNRFVKDAVNTAEKMLNDLKLSKEIEIAKHDAKDKTSEFPELNNYQLVQFILKERGHEISLEEIKRLWEKKLVPIEPVIVIDTPNPKPVKKTTSILKPSLYRGNMPKRVFVIDTWYNVNTWRDVKIVTYNHLIKIKANLAIEGVYRVSKDRDEFHEAIKLDNSWFTEGNRSADAIVGHCKNMMKFAGYEGDKELKIETDVEL